MKLVRPVALAALALVAAGCSNTVLSNGSFASKADAICASFDTANARLSAPGSVAALKSEEALLGTALTKLGAVSAPLDRGPQYEAFLFEFSRVPRLLGQLAAATAAHNDTKIRSLQAQVRGSESDGKSSASEAGLKGCL